jgi:hypothetical protein
MAGRETTVLCAGIVAEGRASTDALRKDAARLAQTLAHAALVSGGRIAVRRERDVIALFAAPDAAASAALRMHAYALAMPSMDVSLGLRMAVHSGPVGRGDQIFGRTIDLALELLDAAGAGEALISGHAVAGLSAGLGHFVGPRGSGAEDARRLLLGELVFRKEAKLYAQRAQRMQLRLAYRSKSIVQRREGDTATIGSDAACELAVEGQGAAQRHCTILRHQGAYLLRDHSARGTFVTAEGGTELAVRGAEVALSGRGVISFDRPGSGSDELVRYSCER